MTISRITVVLTAAIWGLVLWIAAGKTAAPPTLNDTRFSDPLTEARYTQAVEWWGGPPSNCASITRALVPTATLQPNAVAEATVPTEPGTACTLRISEALPPCAVITTMRHEVGHLRGLGHSADANNIMHAPSPRWYCRIEYWQREILELKRSLWEVHRERQGDVKHRNLSLYRYELKSAHIQLRRAEAGAALPHP